MGTPDSRLSRRLGVGDGVAVGLGAMIGTGVFVVWQPAAARAGSWLLAGLVIAAFVAYCNASSTSQLAAVHPRAGGAYVYGRERLGEHWGALAGYAFVIGKLASCATAALAVGYYLWPERPTVVALIAVALVTAVDLAGVRRTARATKVLLAVVLVVLVTVVVVGFAGAGDVSPFTGDEENAGTGVTGVLGAAAVLFYAFAGYARITVLGEEMRDPAHSIPRAVAISLASVLVLYALVGTVVVAVLGADGAAGSEQPVRAVADAVGASWLMPAVTVAAGVAALGALLSLVTGVGRTSFAMAAEGDLPRVLAVVHPHRKVPHRAELAAGVVTAVAVLAGDLTTTLSISAFAVLVYYAVANTAALRLGPDERRRPPWLAVAGLVSCVLLAASLPWPTIAMGVGTLAVAMLARAAVLRNRRRA